MIAWLLQRLPHRYRSTSCRHGHHSYCSSMTGKDLDLQAYQKMPAECKFCKAPCVCKCHKKGN